MGAGIVLGYTYKRSVTFLLGFLYTKLNQTPLWHSYSKNKEINKSWSIEGGKPAQDVETWFWSLSCNLEQTLSFDAFIPHPKPCEVEVRIAHFTDDETFVREVKWLAWGCTAWEWQNLDSNPTLLILNPPMSNPVYLMWKWVALQKLGWTLIVGPKDWILPVSYKILLVEDFPSYHFCHWGLNFLSHKDLF